MSEFGGLQKHEKIQHALVGLGSAALAAPVASFFLFFLFTLY